MENGASIMTFMITALMVGVALIVMTTGQGVLKINWVAVIDLVERGLIAALIAVLNLWAYSEVISKVGRRGN